MTPYILIILAMVAIVTLTASAEFRETRRRKAACDRERARIRAEITAARREPFNRGDAARAARKATARAMNRLSRLEAGPGADERAAALRTVCKIGNAIAGLADVADADTLRRLVAMQDQALAETGLAA